MEEGGIVKGQGSFNDSNFGIVYFTYDGVFTEDNEFDILYSLSGGLVGYMEMIGSRV